MLPTSQNSCASSGMEVCENSKTRRKMDALKGLSLLAHTKAQMHFYLYHGAPMWLSSILPEINGMCRLEL